MTIHVSKVAEDAIIAAVQGGHFASADQMVEALVREYAQRIPQQPAATQPPSDGDGKPIWGRILERTAPIPEEEWDKLPADLAEQHDHYLYGTPKRSEP